MLKPRAGNRTAEEILPSLSLLTRQSKMHMKEGYLVMVCVSIAEVLLQKLQVLSSFSSRSINCKRDSTVQLRSLSWWARGALTVLPQPQLQGASGTVIAARFEHAVSHSLS